MYIILVGAGNVGVQLAKRFIARGHEVLLMEKDSTQARKLGALLGDEHVVHADGCDIVLQKENGFGRADVVVAVTGEDEDNLIVCQLAKSVWGVNRVLARVNDPTHEDIFRDLGIDDTVSATSIIFNLIDQQLAANELIPIGALHRGNVEVVESILSPRSPLIGKAVRELQLPPGTFLVFLMRDGVGSQINGDTVLAPNDMLVALVPVAQAESLKTVLCPGSKS
jgi:trk system potassium uptake protein TrkA